MNPKTAFTFINHPQPFHVLQHLHPCPLLWLSYFLTLPLTLILHPKLSSQHWVFDQTWSGPWHSYMRVGSILISLSSSLLPNPTNKLIDHRLLASNMTAKILCLKLHNSHGFITIKNIMLAPLKHILLELMVLLATYESLNTTGPPFIMIMGTVTYYQRA